MSSLRVLADAELYSREAPFSYTCNSCSRCCYHKRIHVNPYEIARLADALATTTTSVIAAHTESGTSLAVSEDGACTFLGERGCSVHADRPLACRLYPLGRIVMDDGTEVFVGVQTHPESDGAMATAGTIDTYLAGQDIEPYTAAARAYRAILAAWARRVRLMEDDAGVTRATILDVDAALAAECDRMKTCAPVGVEARVQMHLEILSR